jgi:tRNA threonylcarbamoyladenosine biosynthesis protein TsaE
VSTVELTSASAEDTERIGASLARHLRVGDVVAVEGELGAGKTTLVRGACRVLGVAGPVTSPTYTIGNRYDGYPPVAHLDLYRVTEVTDADWGDLEPYFEGTIVFVEWAAAGARHLPEPRVRVRLEHVDEHHRRIRVESGEPDVLAGLL